MGNVFQRIEESITSSSQLAPKPHFRLRQLDKVWCAPCGRHKRFNFCDCCTRYARAANFTLVQNRLCLLQHAHIIFHHFLEKGKSKVYHTKILGIINRIKDIRTFVKGRHNLTIFLDNFLTNFRRNSTRKKVRWFEELIKLNHLTIFITKFNQKLVEKLYKKNSAISLALIAARSVFHLTLRYFTRREFLREILYKNVAIIAIQHSKIYFVVTFGDFSHTVE